MNKVYPSIAELIPPVLLGRLPSALVTEIKIRYETLGEKYLTDELTPDGRRINDCMNKSSVNDCREEIVDSVFNMLVEIFKENTYKRLSNEAYTVLEGLIEIYSLLVAMQENEHALSKS